LDEEKSKYAGLAQQTGLWPSIFAQDVEAGKSYSKAEHRLLIDWIV
jgi:hypothetical protein